jgi:hypothetical protein
MDNSSRHRAVFATQKLEENGIGGNPGPTFSLDIASSDFFLFGALKAQFAGSIFESAEELVEEICEMTRTIL